MTYNDKVKLLADAYKSQIETIKGSFYSEEDKIHLKGAALKAIEKYFGDRYCGMIGRNTYDPEESLCFLDNDFVGTPMRGKWAITKSTWDNLKLNIERTGCIGICCLKNSLSYKIYAILNNWLYLYRGNKVNIEECMIGLYKEYIAFGDNYFKNTIEVKEKILRK